MTTTQKSESSLSQDDRVEKTFELLRHAKKFELESDYWLATKNFVEAHQTLQVLAEEENEKIAAAAAAVQNDHATGDNADGEGGGGNNNNSNNNNNSSTPEKIEDIKRIAKLYASKADEYWKQSRYCLIKAMEQEKTHDEQQVLLDNDDGDNGDDREDVAIKDDPCVCISLDDDQARARNRTFSVLFSRPIVEEISTQSLPTTTTTTSTSEVSQESNDIGDEDDLEARLKALNSSLPSGFKTTEERMSEVNKGLNKLGLSLYTQKQPFARFHDELLPKSDEEQIDEIMAQAKDEATVDQLNRGGDAPNNNVRRRSNKEEEEEYDDDDDCDFSDDSDSDDEKDALLDDDQLAMKTIQKKVVKAQVKLAELLAILDEARSKKAREDLDDEENDFKTDGDNDDDDDDDDDSFHDIQKHDVAFIMLTGKKKLKSAQRDMRKALAEWEDISL